MTIKYDIATGTFSADQSFVRNVQKRENTTKRHLSRGNGKDIACVSLRIVKDVVDMILIEKVYEDVDIRSEYVRCPSCKRGRLCDKPKGEVATVIALKTDYQGGTGSKIILKCPKCSQKFLIHLSKE